MRKHLDEIHEDVPEYYYHEAIRRNLLQRYWHQRRFDAVRKLVRGFVAGWILDIGCHGGRFTYELSTMFPHAHIHGIDLSKKAVAYAKKTYPNMRFTAARAENLPFPNSRFDLVTCFEMLEHVPDPQQVVLEIKRVLVPGGSTIILVPAENLLFRCVWFVWTRFGPGRVWNHAHVQKFYHQTLDSLLTSHGFVIKDRTVFLGGMLLLVHAELVKYPSSRRKRRLKR